MKYDELFSRGATLKDVPISVHGISLLEYRIGDIHQQCSEYVSKLNPADAPLNRKAVHTKRDDYGLKGA